MAHPHVGALENDLHLRRPTGNEREGLSAALWMKLSFNIVMEP